MAYFYGPASSQKLLQITFFKHFLSEFRILQTGDLISLPCSIHAGNQGGQSGAFLLCTGLELPQTLFEAARGMLTLPDLLTGIGIGLFGLCGLVCAWEACGKETE